MSRQDANAAFALTSFLYGGNADYIDDLYARYEADPNRSMPSGRSFFQSLKDDARDVERTRAARPGARPDWPPLPSGDLSSALDGNWADRQNLGAKVKAQAQSRGVELISSADVERATRDSVRALMLIRAYRACAAISTPISIRSASSRRRTRRSSIRAPTASPMPISTADLPRQGARPRIRRHPPDRHHPAAHLLPDTRRRIHAHLRTARRRAGFRSASRDRTRRSASPAKASAHPQQAGRGRRLREILRREIHRHQALRSRRRRIDDPGAGTDHQARRRAWASRRSSSACRIAAGSTCWRR
jgi:hypothetical protein